MMRLVAVLTLAVLPATFVFADDSDVHWPGWLGPHRNGWVAGFRQPPVWPQTVQPAWSTAVGTGYSSPLVANGRVYQQARQGEKEVLWCLDLKTGSEIWRQGFVVPFKMGGGGEWHGKGPKSSPVLADGRLFTLSISGVLSAWDVDAGDLLWQRDYAAQFEQSHPYWGASTSPIVDEDRVVVHFGNDERGVLVALDVETGKELWAQGEDGPSYSSPLLAEIEGVRQIIEWNHRALVGVESRTGKLLWEYPFPHAGHNQNMPTPAIHRGRILLGGENRGLLCIEPRLIDGHWSATKRWEQKKVALDMSSAVVNDGLLFGFSHYGKGRLFCLGIENGEIRWQGPGRAGGNVAFLAVPGLVVALSDRAELQILKATGDALETVAVYQVGESPTWAPPVLLEDGILIKDQENLRRWSWGKATPPSNDERN